MKWVIVLSSIILGIAAGLTKNMYECIQFLLTSAAIIFLMCLFHDIAAKKQPNKEEHQSYFLVLLLFAELGILTTLCLFF